MQIVESDTENGSKPNFTVGWYGALKILLHKLSHNFKASMLGTSKHRIVKIIPGQSKGCLRNMVIHRKLFEIVKVLN